eukprot:5045990-Amphidinium_carterae.1
MDADIAVRRIAIGTDDIPCKHQTYENAGLATAQRETHTASTTREVGGAVYESVTTAYIQQVEPPISWLPQ